jgi:uncharacterized membrane protein
MVFAMNRALLLSLLFVACGPEQVVQEEHGSNPVTEEPPVTMTNTNEQPLTGFPCDVRQVLQTNCAGCHAGLTYVTHFKSRSDLLEMNRQGQHQLGVEIALRLRPDSTSPMPPTGVTQRPTLTEIQLIDGWVQSGMPAGACGDLVDDR